MEQMGEEVREQKVSQGQREMLEQIFATLAPNNGRVGVKGLRALYIAMGMEPTDEELELTIQQIDKRGYGTITLDDFINNL
jgi:Ca2+-binding EF-hand superfamily protein